MDDTLTKPRGEVAPDKLQVLWRVSEKVLRALQHDAERQGFSSIPLYLNHILTVHYFEKHTFMWSGERVEEISNRVTGVRRKKVNWRILKRVVYALQAEADQFDMTVPNLLNAMLTFHYFGSKGDRKS